MTASPSEDLVRSLLGSAGIHVNGDQPWDLQVHRPAFFDRLLAGGSLALGESYMDGWWDCPALDTFFDRLLRCRLDRKVRKTPRVLLGWARAVLSGSPGRLRAFRIGTHHYDLGNDLFAVMLDKWMNYSCAYWNGTDSLDAAQEAKMELICRKLHLQPGMRVLDIGCGWGGLAAYAARHFGVQVHGITVSRQQAQLARHRCAGLPVTIAHQDYRDVKGTFDRIVSVGMFEHVGAARYRAYLQQVRARLAPDGLFLLHTIAGNRSVHATDSWIATYIFPNSMLPSARQISAAAEQLLVMEDWHSFGPDYDPTLMAWYRNFTENWHRLRGRYDDRFYRMWTYYLLSCAGSFRARRNQLWQIVFSRDGLREGYRSFRQWGCKAQHAPPTATDGETCSGTPCSRTRTTST